MSNPEQDKRVNGMLSSVINDAESAASAAKARNRRGYLVSLLSDTPRVELTHEVEEHTIFEFRYHVHHWASRVIRELLPRHHGKK